LIRPRIELKPVEGDSALANGNLSEVRTDFGVEPIPVHRKISPGGTRTDPARLNALAVNASHFAV
jgi:hypothetical protein